MANPKDGNLSSLKQAAYEELWNNNSYVEMMGRLQANVGKDGDKGVMDRVRAWMNDLFGSKEPPKAIQDRIDAAAKKADKGFTFKPNPRASDPMEPGKRVMYHRNDPPRIGEEDKFMFIGDNKRNRDLFKKDDYSPREYINSQRRKK